MDGAEKLKKKKKALKHLLFPFEVAVLSFSTMQDGISEFRGSVELVFESSQEYGMQPFIGSILNP